jgi:hypothetical protein
MNVSPVGTVSLQPLGSFKSSDVSLEKRLDLVLLPSFCGFWCLYFLYTLQFPSKLNLKRTKGDMLKQYMALAVLLLQLGAEATFRLYSGRDIGQFALEVGVNNVCMAAL